MKPQDIFLFGLFVIAIVFIGCRDDDDSPTPPQSTCDLICFNGGLANVDSCLCACLPGFSGDSCQVVEPVCHLQCLNSGVLDADPCSCDCPVGFEGDSCEVSVSDLLTVKNWMIEEGKVEPGLDFDRDGTLENDFLSALQECNLDDFYNFDLDGSYTFEEGATKCDPNAPEVIDSGNWSWNSEYTFLTLENASGSSNEIEIISLTSTEMKWRVTQNLQDSAYIFTYTWK
ncbi:MAG: lipocalin family protein [Cryomorphaceae bacterium]